MKTTMNLFAACLLVLFAAVNSLSASVESPVEPAEVNYTITEGSKGKSSLKLSYRAPNGQRIFLETELFNKAANTDQQGYPDTLYVKAVANVGGLMRQSKRTTQQGGNSFIAGITIKGLPPALEGARITIGRSKSGFKQGSKSLFTKPGLYVVKGGNILISVI